LWLDCRLDFSFCRSALFYLVSPFVAPEPFSGFLPLYGSGYFIHRCLQSAAFTVTFSWTTTPHRSYRCSATTFAFLFHLPPARLHCVFIACWLQHRYHHCRRFYLFVDVYWLPRIACLRAVPRSFMHTVPGLRFAFRSCLPPAATATCSLLPPYRSSTVSPCIPSLFVIVFYHRTWIGMHYCTAWVFLPQYTAVLWIHLPFCAHTVLPRFSWPQYRRSPLPFACRLFTCCCYTVRRSACVYLHFSFHLLVTLPFSTGSTVRSGVLLPGWVTPGLPFYQLWILPLPLPACLPYFPFSSGLPFLVLPVLLHFVIPADRCLDYCVAVPTCSTYRACSVPASATFCRCLPAAPPFCCCTVYLRLYYTFRVPAVLPPYILRLPFRYLLVLPLPRFCSAGFTVLVLRSACRSALRHLRFRAAPACRALYAFATPRTCLPPLLHLDWVLAAATRLALNIVSAFCHYNFLFLWFSAVFVSIYTGSCTVLRSGLKYTLPAIYTASAVLPPTTYLHIYTHILLVLTYILC